jgi:hypothetical protein
VFFAKNAESLESKRVAYCVSAKKGKRVRENVKGKGIAREHVKTSEGLNVIQMWLQAKPERASPCSGSRAIGSRILVIEFKSVVYHNGTSIIETGYPYPTGCCAPKPVGAPGLHPGTVGENAIVRWTAPANGLYKVTAKFSGQDYGGQVGTTTDVADPHNGVQLYAGNVVAFGSHYDQSFSGTVSVLAGDTIDFTVGYGMVATGNDYAFAGY